MTYKEFIQDILDNRGRFNCGEEYCERHHIVPKCMGGTDTEDNLIDLYGREHYEAHKLLALENPECLKLVSAWWMMSHIKEVKGNYRYIPTGKEYEEARKNFSILVSERMKNQKILKGKDSPMYGKHLSEETKEKLSLWNKKRIEEQGHPMKGKHHKKETKEKIRMAKVGKHLSEKTKKKMSDYFSTHHNCGMFATNGRNPNAKKVVCDGRIFSSIAVCALYYNVEKQVMARWLRLNKIPEEWKAKGLSYYFGNCGGDVYATTI